VHSLSVIDSSLSSLQPNTFNGLSHVNEIQIRQNRLGTVEENSLAGLFTVGSVHFQSNQVARLAPRALVGTENLGSLVFSYNTVKMGLESGECLKHRAQRFVFTENTLHCDCQIRWIYAMADEQDSSQQASLLGENFCDQEQHGKMLGTFRPMGCQPLTRTTLVAPKPTNPPTVLIGIRSTPYPYWSHSHTAAAFAGGRRNVPHQQRSWGGDWNNESAVSSVGIVSSEPPSKTVLVPVSLISALFLAYKTTLNHFFHSVLIS